MCWNHQVLTIFFLSIWLIGLMSKQRADGGWGEHYSGCLEDSYVEHPQSQVVMTSGALLALLEGLPPNATSVTRGVPSMCFHQTATGPWPPPASTHVFSCLA